MKVSTKGQVPEIERCVDGCVGSVEDVCDGDDASQPTKENQRLHADKRRRLRSPKVVAKGVL